MHKGIKKIRNELDDSVPDLKDRIKDNIDFAKIKEQNSNKKSKFNKIFYPIFSVLVTVAIILCVSIPLFLNNDDTKTGVIASNTYLTISINPSIELEINNDGNVIKQIPLNEDGVMLLLKENLIGLSINQASRKIIQLAKDYGFLDSNKNIKIHVDNKNTEIEQKNYNLVKKEIDDYSKTLLLNLSITELNEEEFEDLLELYDENKLNAYEKAQLEEFRNDLLKIVNDKENSLRALIDLILPYSNDKENESIIQNIDEIKTEIINYSNKFNFNIKDFEIANLTYADMYEIHHELKDDLEEIEEIYDDLISGADEDDYEDLLEDLFDYVKESMFEDEK